uniref:Secreted Defensin-like peptide n=1 Tax=Pristhesancus plagipennis TaxID=1955184 RepID=A0A2K8JWT0_PRIPG|nr:secreted Defensin-like peptide [Pristhesancus plagipennis]
MKYSLTLCIALVSLSLVQSLPTADEHRHLGSLKSKRMASSSTAYCYPLGLNSHLCKFNCIRTGYKGGRCQMDVCQCLPPLTETCGRTYFD